MNFYKEHADRVEYIEEVIKKYLPKETGWQSSVIEAMNYSMLNGGKRIRPLLMLETCRFFQKAITPELEPFMVAIEMIHSYSLVHDDLPAMDNDEYRRGRKTTHIVYGEALGILAGDGLLNYAYEVACTGFEATQNILRVVEAMKVLTKKPGIYGMIGGQVIDIESNHSSIEAEKLNVIYSLKTSALIEASMVIGAILGGASEKEQELIEKIASDIGLAFQIQDDILDVTGSLEILGKNAGSDEKNHKITYVTLYGIEKAKSEVVRISNRAIENLHKLTTKERKNEFLMELLSYLIGREK